MNALIQVMHVAVHLKGSGDRWLCSCEQCEISKTHYRQLRERPHAQHHERRYLRYEKRSAEGPATTSLKNRRPAVLFVFAAAILLPDSEKEDQIANEGVDIPSCDSAEAAGMVRNALENNADSKTVAIHVLDFGKSKELLLDKRGEARFCEAQVELNSGEAQISYRLFNGPSGRHLVEVRVGEDAFNTASMIATKAAGEPTAKRQIVSPIVPPATSPQSTSSPAGESASNDEASSGDADQRQEIMTELESTRKDCMKRQQGQFADKDELDEVVRFDATHYANINLYDPTLLTPADHACWNEVSKIIDQSGQ